MAATLIIAACVMIVSLCVRMYWNTFRLIIRDVQVEFISDAELPNLRILQLSDLHMERLSISSHRLIALVKPTEPNLIVLTGDYLDQWNNVDKCLVYLEALVALQPRYGVVLVFGNHDHYLGEAIDLFQQKIEAIGCKVLRNQSLCMDIEGFPVNIIGVDDYYVGKSDLKRSFEGIGHGFNLMLSHDPDLVLHLNDSHSVDYILSGHLHGGQFNVPFAFRLFPMGELPKQKIVKGLHMINGRPVYINAGLGQSGVNARLRSRPEITIHHLRHAVV